MDIYQLIGYIGSVLVAISLMMKNILKLRTINLIGASTFAFYGYLVNAYPVVILNSFIALVDIVYLAEMLKKKEHFTLIPVLDKSHVYMTKFLDFYEKDIKKYFPDFDYQSLKNCSCFFILRNLIPVGLFVYKETSEEEINVLLDYAIPDYRDFKNAKFVYSAEQKFLREKGYKKLITKSAIPKHIKYLLNVGFKKDENDPELYRKTIWVQH